MLDPGALGTLIIGLETIRREEARIARGLPPAGRLPRQRRPVRRRVAAVLRRTADRLEPRPTPATAGC